MNETCRSVAFTVACQLKPWFNVGELDDAPGETRLTIRKATQKFLITVQEQTEDQS
jgi:hypothetical protein